MTFFRLHGHPIFLVKPVTVTVAIVHSNLHVRSPSFSAHPQITPPARHPLASLPLATPLAPDAASDQFHQHPFACRRARNAAKLATPQIAHVPTVLRVPWFFAEGSVPKLPFLSAL